MIGVQHKDALRHIMALSVSHYRFISILAVYLKLSANTSLMKMRIKWSSNANSLFMMWYCQEGAADDDGVPKMGTLLSGLEQRGTSKAHQGTEPRPQPGLSDSAVHHRVLQMSLAERSSKH